MENKTATMNLPMDLIQPAINAHVAQAITQALGGAEQVVGTLVNQVMTRKVDHNGNASTYHDSKPWIQWIAEDLVKNAIRSGLQELIEQRKEDIKQAIAKAMKDGKSAFHKKILTAAVDGLASSMSSGYRVNIEFKPNE